MEQCLQPRGVSRALQAIVYGSREACKHERCGRLQEKSIQEPCDLDPLCLLLMTVLLGNLLSTTSDNSSTTALAACLMQVCHGGRPAAARIFGLALPKLLPLCSSPLPADSPPASPIPDPQLAARCLALSVLCMLCRAAAATEATAGGSTAGAAGLPLLDDIIQVALGGSTPGEGPAWGPAAAAAPGDDYVEEEEEDGSNGGQMVLWVADRGWYTPRREAALWLEVARAAFSIPGAAGQLPPALVQSAVGTLVACILAEGAANRVTLGSAASSGNDAGRQEGPAQLAASGLAGRAVAALCVLAANGGDAETVAQQALPLLAAAATAGAAAAGAEPAVQLAAGAKAGPMALAAIRQLAGSHPALKAAALSLLDESLQRVLPAAIEAAAAPEPLPLAPLVLAQQLLAAAEGVIAAGGAVGSDQAGIAPLVSHVVEVLLALPPASQV